VTPPIEVSSQEISTFILALPPSLQPEAHADGTLVPRLEDLIVTGRGAWPELVLSATVFLTAVAKVLPDNRTLAEGLASLKVDELFLAAACSAGDPEAIAAFRASYLSGLRAAVAKSAPESAVDDVVQQVLVKLFVGGESGPAIAKYAGRGSLADWVQIMAIRDAKSALRKKSATPISDMEAMVDRVIATDDPELESLKRRYRSAFKSAFQDAFTRLEPRARNILRLEHLDGLNIDRIGAIYGVHRATVARWRASARQALLTETKRSFQAQHRIGASEFESIMRLIQSQLDVSLDRLLESDDKK